MYRLKTGSNYEDLLVISKYFHRECSSTVGLNGSENLERHLLECEGCLREYSELVIDRYHETKTGVELNGKLKTRETQIKLKWEKNINIIKGRQSTAGGIISFRYAGGVVTELENLPFFRVGPAFRSEIRAIIYSGIVALEKDYVILEISGDTSDIKIQLEKGLKNNRLIRISLYINERLSDKRQLGDRLEWKLSAFSPGFYRLKLEDKVVLEFHVQE